MPSTEYTAEQALAVLMGKLEARDEELAAHVQEAIDAGKDVSETEPAVDRRKKARVYRKTVPFSHEEAIQIALNALQAYFIEQPLFVNSAADNLAKAAVGIPRNNLPDWEYSSAGAAGEPEPVSLEGKDQEKLVEIEMRTETQISRTGDETQPLKRTSVQLIDQQWQHIKQLRALTHFNEV